MHENDREVDIYLDHLVLSGTEGGEGGSSNAGVDDRESYENSQFLNSDFDVDESGEGATQLFEAVVEEVGLDGQNEAGDKETAEGHRGEENVESSDEEDEGYGGDILSYSSNFDSGKDSDKENSKKFRVFSQSDTYDPKFDLGMMFSSKNEFRVAVQSHAVKTMRNVKITKDDNRRIYARCVEEGCEWRINALVVKSTNSFQIREYYSKHTCGKAYHVKQCTSSWLGQKFEDAFRIDPGRNIKGWRHDVIKKIRVNVSRNQAYRAKWKALARIEGSSTDQYGKLWDYAEELRSSNPGSTVILKKATNNDKPVFGNFYVCFKGLKEGYLAGIDPNNDSFPLCYAVVGEETRETWEWYLYLKKHDLHIENAHEWTFMSNKQKGLVPAFETVFPTSDNSVETYLRVYQHCIYPVNGPEKWKQTGGVPLLPPNLGREGHNKKGCKKRKETESCNITTENAYMEEGENTQMPDWGEETDWNQISLEVSNFLETGNFSSQASLQQTAVTTSSSQGGPSNEAESVGIEKQPVVTARSKQSGPSKKRKSTSIEKQPKMPPMPTTNLPNSAPIPPARGGVTIRPPVPFARGHPRVAVSISTQKMLPLQYQFKVIDKDSQKYVMM
ncbi:UNVERIFIED_CONTAM: hypothetical protein Scaly_2029200 [Sesamum calycinum]|uniref:Transposase MuDR plant domain-containing protein n=1 Tax=Sesamum calycinum TaxID=2727403 RepID=A0AAW2N542_9LAMI